ncbi:GTPase IMAP family member 7-like isoform X2 [Saccostrea cucullata]|uniref:GTPase IMAP family member 7-like isoform X2 n=1 Tax=Saccostrea cuccullata TaxID=36930 RepID=UPI002ED34A29
MLNYFFQQNTFQKMAFQKMLTNLTRIYLLLAIVNVIFSGLSSSHLDHDVGVPVNQTRLILIGKTGVGKSTTGNAILGFRAFKTKVSAMSVTNHVQFNTSKRFQKSLLVVDTPGLYDTNKTKEEVVKEITKCFNITSPGIHAIVLVLQIGRFTEEEKKTVDFYLELFGKDVKKYLMIVFTGKDRLDYEGITLEEYIESLDNESTLKALLNDINGRYTAIGMGGNITELESDVKRILKIVMEMNKNSQDVGYTNEHFKEAEAVIRQKQEEYAAKLRENEKAKEKKMLEKIRMEHQIQIVNNNQNIGGFVWAAISLFSSLLILL